MVAILARYAARFSVRALDLTVDSSMLWVGVALATAGRGVAGVRAAAAGRRRHHRHWPLERQPVRITTGTNRRLRLFAVTQIAASFVLLAGSGMLLDDADRAAVRRRTGFDMERVLGDRTCPS